MSSTRIVNIHLEPWRSDRSLYHYIGRKGHGRDGLFGNPFTRRTPDSLAKFRRYFLEKVEADSVFRAFVLALGVDDKPLGCFCVDEDGQTDPPGMCHGFVLAGWLDEHQAEVREFARDVLKGGRGCLGRDLREACQKKDRAWPHVG